MAQAMGRETVWGASMRRLVPLVVLGFLGLCSTAAGQSSDATERAYKKAMDDLNSPKGREAELACSVKLGFKLIPKNAIEAANLYGDDKASDYTMCVLDRLHPPASAKVSPAEIDRKVQTEMAGPKGKSAREFCTRSLGIKGSPDTGMDIVKSGQGAQKATAWVDCVVNRMDF